MTKKPKIFPFKKPVECVPTNTMACWKNGINCKPGTQWGEEFYQLCHTMIEHNCLCFLSLSVILSLFVCVFVIHFCYVCPLHRICCCSLLSNALFTDSLSIWRCLNYWFFCIVLQPDMHRYCCSKANTDRRSRDQEKRGKKLEKFVKGI